MSNVVDDELFDLEKTVDEKSDSLSTRVKNTGIWKFFIEETERPYYAHLLTPLGKALPVWLHFVEKKGERICYKSPILSGKKFPNDTECPYCALPNNFDKSKLDKPYSALAVFGYFYDSVGNQITVKDNDGNPKKGEDGEIMILDDQPVKVCIIKRGKEDVNITKLKDLDRDGELLDTLLEIQKYPKELKKPVVFSLAHEKSVNKKFKDILPNGCVVPEDIRERFNNLTKEEAWGLAINHLSPDWDNSTIKKHCIKPVEDVKAETEKDLAASLDGGKKK